MFHLMTTAIHLSIFSLNFGALNDWVQIIGVSGGIQNA